MFCKTAIIINFSILQFMCSNIDEIKGYNTTLLIVNCIFNPVFYLIFSLITTTHTMRIVASHIQFGVLDHLSDIPGGFQGGTPLVFFDRNTRDTIVLSPSSSFMDTSQATWTTSKGERVIGFGPIGSLKKVTTCSHALSVQ